MKPLNLPRQYKEMGADIDLALTRVFESGRFIGGDVVRDFEMDFADYLSADYCVGVDSGTDALTIALVAAGVNRDVIVPANSAFPTAEAVVRAGCRPVFCDVDPDTYTITAELAEPLMTPDVEAIVPVHLYGHPCDMDPLVDLAIKYGLFVLEDCAHAHGARYKSYPVGSGTQAAAFSFNPTKILGAAGDAGAIVTSDPALALKCRQLADHGRIEKYVHQWIGYNSRLDAVQAAVLGVKLDYLDDWVDHRRSLAEIYRERLENYVELPVEANWARHSYHQFVIRLNRRDKVRTMLFVAYDIEIGIHYPLPLPQQPALEQYAGGETCVTDTHARRILSLPINESMYAAEAHAVCDALLAVIE